MGKFFKNFGLGLVYIILLPLLLAVLAVLAVYGICLCIVQFFQAAILFFKGEQGFPPLWEDVKVAEIKKAQMDAMTAQAKEAPAAPAPAQPAGPSTVYVQQNYYQGQNKDPNKEQGKQPIDATGFFHGNSSLNQPSAPTLDVTKNAQALPNPTPGQISQQANPELQRQPVGYIDISQDDGKEGK